MCVQLQWCGNSKERHEFVLALFPQKKMSRCSHRLIVLERTHTHTQQWPQRDIKARSLGKKDAGPQRHNGNKSTKIAEPYSSRHKNTSAPVSQADVSGRKGNVLEKEDGTSISTQIGLCSISINSTLFWWLMGSIKGFTSIIIIISQEPKAFC